MAAQLIFGLIIVLASYAGTAFLMIELLMWVMRRLDDPKASATRRRWAVERQLALELSIQANLAHMYPSEQRMSNIIAADQFGHPQTSASFFKFSGQEESLVPPQPAVHCVCSGASAFHSAPTTCGLDFPGTANSQQPSLAYLT